MTPELKAYMGLLGYKVTLWGHIVKVHGGEKYKRAGEGWGFTQTLCPFVVEGDSYPPKDKNDDGYCVACVQTLKSLYQGAEKASD